MRDSGLNPDKRGYRPCGVLELDLSPTLQDLPMQF
jgi:hypothetical protein